MLHYESTAKLMDIKKYVILNVLVCLIEGMCACCVNVALLTSLSFHCGILVHKLCVCECNVICNDFAV